CGGEGKNRGGCERSGSSILGGNIGESSPIYSPRSLSRYLDVYGDGASVMLLPDHLLLTLLLLVLERILPSELYPNVLYTKLPSSGLRSYSAGVPDFSHVRFASTTYSESSFWMIECSSWLLSPSSSTYSPCPRLPNIEHSCARKMLKVDKMLVLVEHLDRVLKEECVPAVAAEESVGDSGVVGTDLDSGSMIMETQSLATSRHQEGVEGEGDEVVERLSPIFPPRMEELESTKPPPFLSAKSKMDSGFFSGSFQTPGRNEKYPPPPPVRVWTLNFDAASTPNR
ncbi:unnamed protein product, partial [Hymenolepis diminuta]|uniref:PI3K/PI4K domain-containing protein n=1 Tax=Hymenolepis diminuta TaxID=6216 RepID=A0A0R3SXV3_HYMDI